MQAYAIRKWNEYFENNESRKIKNLSWIPMVNKHDGRGYRRVAALPNSVQVFCGWALMLQVASKMPTRGVLCDDDGALTAADIAAKTGYPEAIFEAAFSALIRPEIKWLELIEANLPGDSPGMSRSAGVQGNRTEQKGRERQEREPERPSGMPESLEQAVFMAERIGVPRGFTDTHYHRLLGKGFVDGNGNPIRDFGAHVKYLWLQHGANVVGGMGASIRDQLNALESEIQEIHSRTSTMAGGKVEYGRNGDRERLDELKSKKQELNRRINGK